MNLKEKLIKQKKTRWLDIGCNRNFEKGFYYMDKFPKNKIDPKNRPKYFKMSILNANEKQLKAIGQFDLIRMQHVLEHLSYEEGFIVLENIAKILGPSGIILITTPDLMINVKKYINGQYKNWSTFKRWAIKRIPNDAPASFYFSVFAYSLPITPHKWCYDYKGLKYILKLTKLFKNIRELKFDDHLAIFPFTHNKPEEDVCIIANKKELISL